MRPPSRLTQLEQQQRRKLLAERVSAGQSCRAVSEKYGVVEATVRNACKEFGVIIRHRRRGRSMGIYA